mmetsp:Transcript_15621/g.47120  ORF Transcript_15621/g.47120 Transcript_15621/m.47120 type:complete len:315 (+) Transcript_15621:211-1155(+)
MVLASTSMHRLYSSMTAPAVFRSASHVSALRPRQNIRRGGVVRAEPDPETVRRLREQAEALWSSQEAMLTKLSNDPDEIPNTLSGYETDDDTSMRYEINCDINGACVVVPKTSRKLGQPQSEEAPEDTSPLPMDWRVHDGKGWSIAWDASGPRDAEADEWDCNYVIGTKGWNAFVSRKEFVDFMGIIANIRRNVTNMQQYDDFNEGTEHMLASETERVQMQGRAPREQMSTLKDWWLHGNESTASFDDADLSRAFDVEFTFQSPRPVTGAWKALAVMDFFTYFDSEEGEFLREMSEVKPVYRRREREEDQWLGI